MNLDLRHRLLATLLLVLPIAALSCEEVRETPSIGVRARAAQPALAATRGELPTLAARLWFHSVGDAIVGGGSRYDLRSERGELTFTPGAVGPGGALVAGAPLTLRTLEVGRDGDADEAAGAQSAIGGALQIEHERAREVWVNGADAAEQSFHFDERPKGKGDVVVKVATAGLDCVESTPEGLRFAASDGSSGVFYGHATFIDDAGMEMNVATSCAAGVITLRIPAATVDAATYPAVLDPLVGPSFELTPPIADSTNGDHIAIACSDTTCLVAFSDARDGTARRYGGRFTPDGAILDDVPLVIGAPPVGSEVNQQVGHLQDRFLVVFRTGTTLYGEIIGEDGVVLAPPFTIVANFNAFTPVWSVACGLDDCLVDWITSANVLLANRVSVDGALLDGAGFVVSGSAESNTQISWAQGRYLVAYQPNSSPNSLEARRVENGVVLDASPIVVIPPSAVGVSPSVATNGSDFFITVPGAGSTQKLRGTFISNDGSILPPGPAFQLLAPEIMTNPAQVIWNGTDYSAIYVPGNSFQFLRTFDISPAGVPGSTHFDVWDGGDAQSLAVTPLASGGGVVAWHDSFNSIVAPLRGRRLDATGQPVGSGPFLLANGFNAQSAPAVTAGGGEYLVTWLDRRLASAFVMGARLGADGTILDPNGFIIAELNRSNSPSSWPTAGVDADWNGTSFLVAWTDQISSSERYLRAARVSPAGVVLDPTPIALSSLSVLADRPALAWSGVVHMVTWTSDSGSPFGYFAARVDSLGNVIDAPAIPLASLSASVNPSIAWTGQEFLLTESSGYRTITAAGVPEQGSPVSLGFTPQAMSCHGTSCAFTSFISSALRLVPFDASTKAVGSSTVISNGSGPPSSIVWDGFKFVVVYGSNDLSSWTSGDPPAVVENGPDFANAPRLASLGNHVSLLTYTLRDQVPGSLSRIFATTIDSHKPNGVSCTIAGDCSSGFCVDGVCCNTDCGGTDTSDCQACSVALGAAVNGTCSTFDVGTLCRAAAGPCDVAEACDGSNGTCPVDTFASGTVCRSAAGACDVAEQCTGGSAQCPADARAPSGTVCRGAVGECDLEETCDGASTACPFDGARPQGTPCGSPSNDCASQACTGLVGASATCQSTPKPAGTACRPAAGACDASEVCNGTASTCPPDMKVAPGTTCRPAAGPCDVLEQCDGSSPDCPPDGLRTAGQVCAAKDPQNDCDLDDICDGVGIGCAPKVAMDGAACQNGTGACESGNCDVSGQGGMGASSSASTGVSASSSAASTSSAASSGSGTGGSASTSSASTSSASTSSASTSSASTSSASTSSASTSSGVGGSASTSSASTSSGVGGALASSSSSADASSSSAGSSSVGASGTGGDAGSPPPSGCSCAIADQQPSSDASWAALAVLLTAGRRRRRQASRITGTRLDRL